MSAALVAEIRALVTKAADAASREGGITRPFAPSPASYWAQPYPWRSQPLRESADGKKEQSR